MIIYIQYLALQKKEISRGTAYRLFNIYAREMKNEFHSPCIQYADDTNFYEHCKVSEIPQSITTLTNAAKSIF